jgi:hypothetical protein
MFKQRDFCLAYQSNDTPTDCIINFPQAKTYRPSFEELSYYSDLLGAEPGSSILEQCNIVNETCPSKDWYHDCIRYVENLDKFHEPRNYDLGNIMSGYSHHGDVVINEYLRGNYEKSLQSLKQYSSVFGAISVPFAKSFWSMWIEKHPSDADRYPDDLAKLNVIDPQKFDVEFRKQFISKVAGILTRSIILGPILDRDIVVYRGMSTQPDVEIPSVHRFRGIMSVSANINEALKFGKYLMIIVVPRGSNALVQRMSRFDYESEILLPHNSTFQIDEKHDETINHFYRDPLGKRCELKNVTVYLCRLINATTEREFAKKYSFDDYGYYDECVKKVSDKLEMDVDNIKNILL